MVLVCHYSGPSKLNATSKRGSYFRHFATLNVSTVVRKSYRPANTACLTFAWGWNNQKGFRQRYSQRQNQVRPFKLMIRRGLTGKTGADYRARMQPVPLTAEARGSYAS
ncbi:uncharacterized protein DFL_004045 [Arthrobotrys flagrans]|uniref:Uncharacterized protein n=1 Tax=Arthrobotrys flagrans TaxID=97331 RepID=A0A437A3K6_ARTFL|nr:hypothetical protein DFL_004045 [Arthrobotrys flagrans]